jgi:hypothetical protein
VRAVPRRSRSAVNHFVNADARTILIAMRNTIRLGGCDLKGCKGCSHGSNCTITGRSAVFTCVIPLVRPLIVPVAVPLYCMYNNLYDFGEASILPLPPNHQPVRFG